MRLSYKDIGKGKPIVFVHSYLWDKDMWLPQLNLFKQQFRCISIDLPGHGDSKEGEIKDLRHLAELVKLTLDELKVDNYIYVGLSVGGMLAPYIYELDREKIDKIIIMDSYSGSEPEETKKFYFSILEIIEKSKYFPKELIEKVAPIFFSPMVDKKSKMFLDFKNSLENISEERLKTLVNLGKVIFGRENSLELLGKIDIPTYFLVGECDIPRPFSETLEMKSVVKNSKFYKIKNAGHISNLENSKKVNQILKKILK